MTLLFYNRTAGKGEFYNIRNDHGNIDLLKSYSGWRKSWTDIVYTFTPTLLFYDSSSGAAEFYNQDDQGNIHLVSSSTYSTGWTHIVRVGVAQDSGFALLLFYNSNTGDARFYMTNGQGGIDQISSDTWSTGWTHILSGSFTSFGNGLLFYNNHSGLAQVYGTDGRGSMQEISSTTLSMGWTHLIAAGVLPDVGFPLLIFYNSGSGNITYCQVDSQGVIDQLTSDTWAKGWTEILYGTIPDVQQGNVIPSLLFYNGTSGTSQFYRLNVPGKIFQLSNTTWAKGWTEILWLELP